MSTVHNIEHKSYRFNSGRWRHGEEAPGSCADVWAQTYYKFRDSYIFIFIVSGIWGKNSIIRKHYIYFINWTQLQKIIIKKMLQKKKSVGRTWKEKTTQEYCSTDIFPFLKSNVIIPDHVLVFPNTRETVNRCDPLVIYKIWCF